PGPSRAAPSERGSSVVVRCNSSIREEFVNRLIAAIAALAIVGLGATSARAQSTLDDVIKRGTLIIGVSLGTPPFGVTNANMEPDGFDVDMGKLIARDLGVK